MGASAPLSRGVLRGLVPRQLSSEAQAARDYRDICAIPGCGPFFIPNEFIPGTATPAAYSDSAGTTAAAVGGVVGKLLSQVGGLSASQATTANKPTLYQTPVTGIRWLLPPSAGAMTVTLPQSITNARTFVATPTGVVETAGVGLGSSFNPFSPFTWFSAYLVIDEGRLGPINEAQRATINRFMARYVPTLGQNLVVNGTFDYGSIGWEMQFGFSWNNGTVLLNNCSTAMYQGGIMKSGAALLAEVDVLNISSGNIKFAAGSMSYATDAITTAGHHGRAIVGTGTTGNFSITGYSATAAIDNLVGRQIL